MSATRCSESETVNFSRSDPALKGFKTGETPEGLPELLAELKRPENHRGYGQYLLGMIAYRIGDMLLAATHLRAWLRRHAGADTAKALTLREELRSARMVLADLESD